MTERQLFSAWYRSVTPDGKVWCESSDAVEVVERSVGRGCTFRRLPKWLVSDGWEPWTPDTAPAGPSWIPEDPRHARYPEETQKGPEIMNKPIVELREYSSGAVVELTVGDDVATSDGSTISIPIEPEDLRAVIAELQVFADQFGMPEDPR